LLGLIDAVAISVAFVLVAQEQWVALTVLLAVLVALNYLYLRPAGLPGKYLAPGVLFLLAFQVYVLFLSTTTAFTNYGSANNGDFNQALSSIIDGTFEPDDSLPYYDVQVVKNDNSGKYAFLLTDASVPMVDLNDPNIPKVFVGGPDENIHQIAPTDFTLGDTQSVNLQFDPKSVKGYTIITDQSVLSGAEQNLLGNYHILLDPNNKHGQFLMANDLTTAQTYNLTMVWDAKAQTLTRQSDGAVFKPTYDGFFHVDGKVNKEVIATGWVVDVGLKNFISIFTDPDLLRPLGRVLTWTFIFAVQPC